MKRLWRIGLGPLAAMWLAACGSGSARPGAPNDGGTDAQDGRSPAKPDASTTADGGMKPVPSDTTPPTFAGVSNVTDASEGRVTVTWDAATDDKTPANQIVYVVYRATTQGGEDYKTTRHCGDPVPDAGTVEQSEMPCKVVAPAGATSVLVLDTIPGHAYYYVARAVDAAGNQDTNTHEFAWTTKDTTDPQFGGVRGLTAVSPTSIDVIWGAGYDLGTPDSALTFWVYVSSTGAPNPDQDTPVFKTAAGAHSAIIGCGKACQDTKLTPSTTYNVMVRSFDAAGNHDDNTRVLKIETPEGIPPAFGGARRANAVGTSVTVFWQPATDNVTDPANIVYDVFQSLQTHGENFSAPTYTSDAGASSIVIPNLQPGTQYYYVVRARDAAGNEDANITQVQALTNRVDDTPPTFNGVQSVTGQSPGTILVSWNAAADDLSSRDSLLYVVYVSASPELPLPATAIPYATVRGATSVTLAGFPPNTTEYVVVRAQDTSGNTQTSNDVQLDGLTLPLPSGNDTTPPTGGGTPTVTPIISAPTKLSVSWTAATDDTASASALRYLVCASEVQTDCVGQSFGHHVVAETAAGVTNATLAFLTSRTAYYVYARAEDPSGNIETDDASETGTTSTSWNTDVRPILFNRCVACHDYDQATAIVNVGSSFLEAQACGGSFDANQGCIVKLVDPGRPQYSMIYRKINPLDLETLPFSKQTPNDYNGLQMPSDSSQSLTGDQDDIIRDWITQGALAN